MARKHLRRQRHDADGRHQHVFAAVDQRGRPALPGYAEQQRSPARAGDCNADAGAEKR